MPRSHPRTLTPKSSLESLRKEAKRWLKALRAGDAAARERLAAALDAPPDAPGLRDVQHALAREHGLPGWPALKAAVAEAQARTLGPDEAIRIVLEHAWDPKTAWRSDPGPARRMVRLHPGIARAGLHMAAICGELDAVRRILAADPAAAVARGGPLDCEPLQYLAYGRLDLPGVADNSVAIAELLIEAGADLGAEINDGWDNPFTVLTGVIGQGEGVKPPHPCARALADLFLARGANPCDTQALYNTSIVGDDASWMDLLWRHSEAQGMTDRWRDPAGGPAIGGRAMGWLDYLLGNAVGAGHRRRAAWLLERGADPNGVNAYSGKPHHEVAQTRGDAEMARMLEAAGAAPVALSGHAAAMAAVMRGDREAVEAMARANPAALKQAAPGVAAHGKLEPLRLVLDLGADVNATGQYGATALHWAVHAGAADAAALLIDRGAEIDVRDPSYHSTPLGWATFLDKPACADLLAPISRDVHALAGAGMLDRLRAVLTEDPTLANALAGGQRDVTPLLCLPDDEDAAAETVDILLSAGADPKLGRREGLDAEAYARKRGLIDAADLIAAARGV